MPVEEEGDAERRVYRREEDEENLSEEEVGEEG